MTPEKYRAKADEMRKLAASAKEQDVRESYTLMAADWDRLARDTEELQQRMAGDPDQK